MRICKVLGMVLMISVGVLSGCGGLEDRNDGEEPFAGEEDTAQVSLGITSGELSTLLMGSVFPVSNGYVPNGVHAGIDWNQTGLGVTAVRSPVNGTIIANTSACGKVAIFDGTNTLIFAHMTQRTGLGVGQAVSMGTYLGMAAQEVGGGCTATGPHLHLEIRTGQNATMALPTNNNTATTLNPLTYTFGPFASVGLVAPANNAPGTTGKAVVFQWSTIQGASTYRLQIANSSGFNGDTCVASCIYNGTTSAAHLSVNVPAGEPYYWRVRAGSSYSGGLWSATRTLRK